MIQEEING